MRQPKQGQINQKHTNHFNKKRHSDNMVTGTDDKKMNEYKLNLRNEYLKTHNRSTCLDANEDISPYGNYNVGNFTLFERLRHQNSMNRCLQNVSKTQVNEMRMSNGNDMFVTL